MGDSRPFSARNAWLTLSRRSLLLVLLAVYLPYFVYTAFTAIDIRAWLGDALLSLALIAFLAAIYKRARLSDLSFFLIFIFLLLAQIGINYAYQYTPYNEWSQALFGLHIDQLAGWERNQYDRFVHLSFGLLFYLPAYELARSLAGIRSRAWRHVIAFLTINACSAIYEVMELVAVYLINAESYWLYLGMQGDVLDAPKDIAMALLGSFAGMGMVLFFQSSDRRNRWVPKRVPVTPLLLLLFLLPSSRAADPEADRILQRSLERYNASSVYTEIHMEVIRPSWENEIQFRAWTLTDDYALVQVTQPARDRGQAFLKRGQDLWHWIPTVEKTVRMSGALLSQSWMGSDFSLNDVILTGTLSGDYTAEMAGEESLRGNDCHVLSLVPHEEAPVVWDKVLAWISKSQSDLLRAEFYDRHGQLVQTMEAFDFRSWEGRRMPGRLTMTPEAKPGHQTVIRIVDYDSNLALDEAFFSLQRMRRMP